MIVGVMDAEVVKDEGLEDRQKILGRVKVLLFSDLLIVF